MPKRSLLPLLSLRGRLRRGGFWLRALALVTVFAAAFAGIDHLLGHAATLVLYPPAAWLALQLGARRYHDLDRSAWWLLLLAIPLLGPLAVAIELFLRGSARGDNRFGPDPRRAPRDYHVVT